MTALVSSDWRQPIATAAFIVAAGGAGAILGAWFFQYGMGLAPCPLCLEQRWPYYLSVPLALIVAIGAYLGAPRVALLGGLGVIVLLLLWGAGLGVYHAGVEWKWWEGPQDCAGGAGFSGGSAASLMERMKVARVVRCDEAAWRDPVVQLSLAGWNVVIALALAGTALAALVSVARKRPA